MSGQFTRLPTDNSNSIRIDPYQHKKAYTKDYKFWPGNKVYLTPKKPVVFKYIDTILFKFELLPNRIQVSRQMADAFRYIKLYTRVHIYSKNKKQKSHLAAQQFIFNGLHTPRLSRVGEYDTMERQFTVDFNIGHVCIELGVWRIDAKFPDMYKLTKELPAYGYTWIRCIGGQIRVHKKTLSHHIPYFKQLFTQYTNNYYIHVQLMDLCELIYYLPPFNRPITTGLTYGSIYRLADHFLCYKLTDIHENFILSILEFAPLSASFMAFEGGIDEYSVKFRRLRKDKRKKKKEWLIRKFSNENDWMVTFYLLWNYPERSGMLNWWKHRSEIKQPNIRQL